MSLFELRDWCKDALIADVEVRYHAALQQEQAVEQNRNAPRAVVIDAVLGTLSRQSQIGLRRKELELLALLAGVEGVISRQILIDVIWYGNAGHLQSSGNFNGTNRCSITCENSSYQAMP